LKEPNVSPPGVCCNQQNVFDPDSGYFSSRSVLSMRRATNNAAWSTESRAMYSAIASTSVNAEGDQIT
jgi:hypothetical protein